MKEVENYRLHPGSLAKTLSNSLICIGNRSQKIAPLGDFISGQTTPRLGLLLSNSIPSPGAEVDLHLARHDLELRVEGFAGF